ncbi:hypothetical protein BDW62DRAFT_201795 [Aspergillus aurantiobrunneus]
MPSITARISNRLDYLRHTVLSPATDDRLFNDNAIPADFFAAHDIRLVHHDFAFPTMKRKISATSLLPPGFTEGSLSPSTIPEFPAYDGSPNIPNIHQSEWSPWTRTRYPAGYLTHWTLGYLPRALPPGTTCLAHLCDIAPVSVPHALDRTTYGFSRYGPYIENRWQSLVYEYTITTGPNNQPPGARDRMRNRTRQPAFSDVEAAESDSDNGLADTVAVVNESKLQPPPGFAFPDACLRRVL